MPVVLSNLVGALSYQDSFVALVLSSLSAVE